MTLLDRRSLALNAGHQPQTSKAMPIPDPAPISEPDQGEEQGTLRLLVVDGNRVSRKVYSKLLMKQFSTCVIREADTGAKALDLCRTEPIDCVLIDYHLPDIKGLKFLDELKNKMQLGFIPVVILTGQGDEMTAVEAMKSGAQDYLVKGTFSQKLLAQAITNAMEKVELLRELEEKRIDLERTNLELRSTNVRLRETQRQLIDAAHKAGMAEIATGVLHNIGNILNSITISVGVLHETVTETKLKGLKRANEMLKTVQEPIGTHPKGKQLIAYYERLETIREEDSHKLEAELKTLMEKIQMITDDISAQRGYATSEFLVEDVDIHELIEHSIKLKQSSLDAPQIRIVKDFEEVAPFAAVKIKLMHVITNLVKNSRESLQQMSFTEDEKEIRIEVRELEGKELNIRISDNGRGIEAADLGKIFNYGFTTKPGGNGIGLHVAANAMTEMGGSIKAFSEGLDHGAEFVVSLPLNRN